MQSLFTNSFPLFSLTPTSRLRYKASRDFRLRRLVEGMGSHYLARVVTSRIVDSRISLLKKRSKQQELEASRGHGSGRGDGQGAYCSPRSTTPRSRGSKRSLIRLEGVDHLEGQGNIKRIYFLKITSLFSLFPFYFLKCTFVPFSCFNRGL